MSQFASEYDNSSVMADHLASWSEGYILCLSTAMQLYTGVVSDREGWWY